MRKPRTKYCGVYYIINIITGRSYIGGSTDITGRYTHHRFMLRRNKHKCKELQKDWNLYGECNFVFNTLQRCDHNELLALEDFYIKYRDNLYNVTRSAIPGIETASTPAKSEAAKRRWSNPAYRAKREAWLQARETDGTFARKAS